MLKSLKQLTLEACRRLHVMERARASRWRSERLLILGYHGIALEDEHLWDPTLYMSPEVFAARLRMIREGDYNVLGLDEGVRRLYDGSLPPRSVVLTFDDGTFDFYQQVYPLLREHGFPATVYLTTYYSDHCGWPVFRGFCAYMLWKARQRRLDLMPLTGATAVLALDTPAARDAALDAVFAFAERERLSGQERQALAGRLAGELEIDFAALGRKRILHLMNAGEIRELAAAGVDFQLHTHRHRTPPEEHLFGAEVDENRARITALSGTCPVHFCYPSGVYRPEFLPWLERRNVVSAVTCIPGFATRRTPPLLLPRIVDGSSLSALEVESWLAGAGAWLPRRGPRA
jgi:peptidoglycan/xylan/chitin deacetylase (PgdA/CDA1 family)